MTRRTTHISMPLGHAVASMHALRQAEQDFRPRRSRRRAGAPAGRRLIAVTRGREERSGALAQLNGIALRR